MNAKHVFFAMLGGIVLLIGLCVAGTYFANKMLVAEGDRLVELRLQNAVLSKQEDALAQAKKDIAKYEELELIARTVVPQEKDQARTTFELLAMAKESKIDLASIAYPNSQLGEVQKKKAAPVTEENQEAPKATPTKTVDSSTTQLTPLTTLKGVYAMEISVSSGNDNFVTYQQLLDYLRRLENNRRTAEVKTLSITPNDGNRNLLSFSITLNSYVRP